MLNRFVRLYKDSYSNHPKAIWDLAILTFINRMGTMVLPFLTLYSTSVLGFSLVDAGKLAGAFGIGTLIGARAGGHFADRNGPRVVIIISLVLGGFSLISLQFASSFRAALAILFLCGILGEAYRPAMSLAVAQHVLAEQTGRSMAFIRLAINLGMTAAPVIGGFIVVSYGYNQLFWIDGLTCVLAAIYFFAASRKWLPIASQQINVSGDVKQIPVWTDKRYLWFLVATFLVGFSFMQWFYSVPVFLKREWLLDERYYGALMACNCFLLVLFEMPLIHYVETNGFTRVAILGGLLCIGFSFFFFLFPAHLVAAVCSMLAFTLGEILFIPLNNSGSIKYSPAGQKGIYISWYWMTWAVVNIIAPSVGLYFAAQFEFSLFWLVIGGLSLLSFSIYLTRLK